MVWGKIGSLQFGQMATSTFATLKFAARRRLRLIFEVRFLGTPMTTSSTARPRRLRRF
jgi:hypothetical protein